VSDDKAKDGKVVTFHYTLTNDAGEKLDSSSGGEPMSYLHGADNIVPGLERAMDGRGVGDAFKVTVKPADGYGERSGKGVQGVPRSLFEGVPRLEPGMSFAAEGPGGETIEVWVVEVEGDTVFVDTEHPLAGETLHFDVKLTGIRDATEEELEHGHPHGEGGHHHD
jgi:FKBP-type peptidyl-prolyl cis-trans isomerase SlyD